MSQLRTVKERARLRELTHLGALLLNETRWTGKFEMVQRFIRIETLIQTIPSLEAYLPSFNERRLLKATLPRFKNFHIIAINLQKKAIT